MERAFPSACHALRVLECGGVSRSPKHSVQSRSDGPAPGGQGVWGSFWITPLRSAKPQLERETVLALQPGPGT